MRKRRFNEGLIIHVMKEHEAGKKRNDTMLSHGHLGPHLDWRSSRKMP